MMYLHFFVKLACSASVAGCPTRGAWQTNPTKESQVPCHLVLQVVRAGPTGRGGEGGGGWEGDPALLVLDANFGIIARVLTTILGKLQAAERERPKILEFTLEVASTTISNSPARVTVYGGNVMVLL